MKRIFAALMSVAFLSLAACAPIPTQKPTYADLTFKHLPNIPLDVAKISVDVTYDPPLEAPHVEDQMPVSLAKSAARWAEDRVTPVGDVGEAVIQIQVASVIEERLAKETGLTGLFTTEQSERYTARLLVRIEASNPNLLNVAEAVADVSRSLTVPEDVSLNRRENELYALTEKLLADFDQQMETNIRNHMGAFMR